MGEPVAFIFKFNNGLIKRSLDGLSDEEVWAQLAGTGNPIGWVLGHLTETRGGILRELGVTFDPGWGGRFKLGSMRQEPGAYPSRQEIEAQWQATHHPMRDAFAVLTAEKLAGPATREIPGVVTFGDQLGFYAMHESYHVGQIGFIRKQLGHSGVAG
jgi:uncharacterized damage-inducible protein DinB